MLELASIGHLHGGIHQPFERTTIVSVAERVGVRHRPVGDQIAASDFDRIETEETRRVVDQALSDVAPLGPAGAAIGVEGIGVGFEPPFLDRTKLKEIRAIDQGQAFKMCQRLTREEGIFGGASTGLNVVGAIKIARELGPGRRIVTLCCDNGVKYLGSHIYG